MLSFCDSTGPFAFALSTLALAWQGQATFDPSQPADGGGFGLFWMFVQTMFALALVCGLAYFLFRWLLPRMQQVSGTDRSMVRVVDRVGIDARKSLLVIEVTGRWLLVATSEAGVHLISELDATSAEEAAGELERLRPTFKTITTSAREAFAERLAGRFNKRR